MTAVDLSGFTDAEIVAELRRRLAATVESLSLPEVVAVLDLTETLEAKRSAAGSAQP